MENQIKKRLLVRIEKIEGQKPKLLESRVLFDSQPIKTEILEKFPEIENRVGEIGKYDIDNSGNVIVVYEQIEKSQLEKMQEKIDKQEETILDLMEALAEIHLNSSGEGGA